MFSIEKCFLREVIFCLFFSMKYKVGADDCNEYSITSPRDLPIIRVRGCKETVAVVWIVYAEGL